MDPHRNAQVGSRQEIRCRDCGHLYTVDAGARSSRCDVCGNIEFHTAAPPPPRPKTFNPEPAAAIPATPAPAASHFALSPELLKSFAAKNALAEPMPEASAPAPLAEIPAEPAETEILARFHGMPDGLAVQEIMERYQVEWQHWAALVKNFADPVYHAAYLAHITRERAFDEASARYREHRAVMLLSQNTRWEAEVAELMITRIETLTTLRMERQAQNGFRVPTWFYLLPVQSSPFRIAWITLGLLTVAKLFRII